MGVTVSASSLRRVYGTRDLLILIYVHTRLLVNDVNGLRLGPHKRHTVLSYSILSATDISRLKGASNTINVNT